MAGFSSLSTAGADEYAVIEAALLETARGRWFLSEFAARNRSDDTERLLSAIHRLEATVTAERSAPELDRMRLDLVEMITAIGRTKQEIAAIHSPDHDQSRLEAASEALDAIVRTTERATSDILEAAEEVQEVAWTLREGGADPRVCDILDQNATRIYTACSFQDITAQRTSRIVHTLRYLEQRLTAMVEIWGGEIEDPAAAPPPAPVSTELAQSDVDAVIATAALPAAPAPAPRPVLPDSLVPDDIAFVPSLPVDLLGPEPVQDEIAGETVDLGTAFAEVDILAPIEKISRFS
ncbi:hypothetical protein [Methylobacterium sp. JK268]